MLGSDIIKILGVNSAHCAVEKEMLEIDPEKDYAILKGTEAHPRIVCEHHEALIKAGKYLRLTIEGRDVINDVDWTTGHNAFEGDVEPKHSPERIKEYMVQ
jgi:hypothetical protein